MASRISFEGLLPPVPAPVGEPQRMMVIAEQRMAYLGLLGVPTDRRLGALTVYVALGRPFRLRLGQGAWQWRQVAVVPPYVAHAIESGDRLIGSVSIEPESVNLDRLPAFLGGRDGADEAAWQAQLRAGFRRWQQTSPPASSAAFDTLFFAEELPARTLEPRIAAVVRRLCANPEERFDAAECAALAGLSFSRFLHVFKAELGVTFRRYRAWKRARSFLAHVHRERELTAVALDIGYPDSTHFSHSIRQTYGLTPREICAGSRRLAIVAHG